MKRMMIGILAGMVFLSTAYAGGIPEELKNAAVVYPGAKLVNIETADLGGGRNFYEIDLDIQGVSYQNVLSFYRQEAGRRGWRVFEDVDRGYSFMLMCHDGQYKIDISGLAKENAVPVRLTIEKQYSANQRPSGN